MTHSEDPRCGRCKAPLRLIPVQVPIYNEYLTMTEHGLQPMKVFQGFRESTEVSDCPRCQGAY